MKRWGRELDHVVSVRFDSELLASVRQLAKAGDVSVSDWIREAAAREAAGLAEIDLLAPDPAGQVHRIRVPAKLLRDAAEARLREAAGPAVVGWTCPHLTMTSGAAVLGKITSGCGCDMQPVYANAAA